MKGWQWNGTSFAPCVSVPIEDRGFRYGMSVFETVAVLDGKPRFLAEHLLSLQDAVIRCGFDLPFDILTVAAMPLGEFPETGVVRVYVTADCRVLLLTEQRQRILKPAYALSPDPVVHFPFPAGSKTGNYWRNISVIEEARAAGFDEAILVSPQGVLISACMANLFVASGGTLKTPALSSGARSGIVREWIKTRRPVIETDLRVQDLIAADEIFLTSSWIGVMPVTGFRCEESAPGTISMTLQVEFDRYQRTA